MQSGDEKESSKGTLVVEPVELLTINGVIVFPSATGCVLLQTCD